MAHTCKYNGLNETKRYAIWPFLLYITIHYVRSTATTNYLNTMLCFRVRPKHNTHITTAMGRGGYRGRGGGFPPRHMMMRPGFGPPPPFGMFGPRGRPPMGPRGMGGPMMGGPMGRPPMGPRGGGVGGPRRAPPHKSFLVTHQSFDTLMSEAHFGKFVWYRKTSFINYWIICPEMDQILT